MLARVEVEHPRDERALQARPGAAQHVEARPRDLDAALEVDDAELRAELPVRQRREIEAGELAFRPQDHVGRLVRADGDIGVREIRNLEHPAVELLLGRGHRPLRGRDALAGRALRGDRPLALRRVGDGADRLRGAGALGAERLERVHRFPPPAVRREERIHLGGGKADLAELGLHALRLGADETDVEHGVSRFSRTARTPRARARARAARRRSARR